MTIDPQTDAILHQINQFAADPETEATIAAARAGADALFTGYAGPPPGDCTGQDRQIPGPDGPIPARIYRPDGAKPSSALPLVIFFHGGGWSLGNVAAYDGLVSSLAVLSGALFISVDYRLAPEHKYPAGLNDCRAVTEWAASHGAEIGADPTRIALMGDSAGGTLAAVVAHQINHGRPRRIKAQFLLYPVMDISRPHDHYPSRITSGNGEYLLSRDGIDTAVDWYLKAEDDPADPTLSPIRQSDLSPMPPTVIVVGGYDPLLDEARVYHDMLQKAGIPSVVKCFDSAIHAFLSFGVLDVAQDGRRYIADQIRQTLFS